MSIFKGRGSEIEFQHVPEDEDHDYVCFGCLLASKDSIDGNTWLGNCIDAIDHLNAHVRAGHLVPNEAIDWIQRAIMLRSAVHQSNMQPTRRFDGSYSAFCESIYHTAWFKENEPGINASLLQKLLQGAGLGDMTNRDSRVAATIITWLGTNVGRCFVEKCQEQMKSWDNHKRVGGKS